MGNPENNDIKLVYVIKMDSEYFMRWEQLENKNQFIYQDLEEKMKALLGTKVSINHKANNQGKIVIDYYSNEELERILYLFQSIPEENS